MRTTLQVLALLLRIHASYAAPVADDPTVSVTDSGAEVPSVTPEATLIPVVTTYGVPFTTCGLNTICQDGSCFPGSSVCTTYDVPATQTNLADAPKSTSTAETRDSAVSDAIKAVQPWQSSAPHSLSKDDIPIRALQGAIYIGRVVKKFFDVASKQEPELPDTDRESARQFMNDEQGRLEQMTHALEALGGEKPPWCEDTTFSFKDHDDYLVQTNDTLSICIGGILSLIGTLAEHDTKPAVEITELYTLASVRYREHFKYLNNVSYPGIPPMWSLSWAFRRNSQTCNLTYDVAFFDDLLLDTPGEGAVVQPNTNITFSTGAHLDANVKVQWASDVKSHESFSTAAILSPDNHGKVETRIPAGQDLHGVFFAAVVPNEAIVDIDHQLVFAGPAVVRIQSVDNGQDTSGHR